MDEAITLGNGGYMSRAELIQESIENLLNELVYPPAAEDFRITTVSAEAARSESRAELTAELFAGLPDGERSLLTVGDITDTRIQVPGRPRIAELGAVKAIDAPLLGLHNRDYASIWALARLASYTQDGFMPFSTYLFRVTRAAWYFGSQLLSLESATNQSGLTTLFPTNVGKQPSAERGFQNFAIGTIAKRREEGGYRASGPLFAWRSIQAPEDLDGLIGVTGPGWDLLASLSDVSLDLPHAPTLAERFMLHLSQFAPADKWGFDHLITMAADEPDRDQLVGRFAASSTRWSPSTASSVTQGYIARAREWGILEPKLINGRYRLTSFGRNQLEQIATNYMDQLESERKGESDERN